MRSLRSCPLLGTAFILCSCATEHLADRTESVSSSAIDIYYDQVLDNIAREKEVPDCLPWAMELTSASVALNDTTTLTGGYAETAQKVTPSAGLSGSRVIQQSWGVVPVTNQVVLWQLKAWYYRASLHKKITNLKPSASTSVTRNSVMTYTNNAVAIPPANSFTPLPQNPIDGHQNASVVTTITNNATAILEPSWGYQDVDTHCFQFCRPNEVPSNTYHASHGNWAVYVRKDDDMAMNNFTSFTLLVMGAIDQIPPKATSSIPGIGSQPLPLLTP